MREEGGGGEGELRWAMDGWERGGERGGEGGRTGGYEVVGKGEGGGGVLEVVRVGWMGREGEGGGTRERGG